MAESESTTTATADAPAPDPKDVDKLAEGTQSAALDPIGSTMTESQLKHFTGLREDALMQMTRQAAKSIKNEQRLERRHARLDPEGAVRNADVVKSERERLSDQEAAFAAAQERASHWIAPEEVEGTMSNEDVELVLNPPEEQRKMTIHVRVVGEIDDGYIMIFEDPAAESDPKLGRVAESERFGTKNRVRAVVDEHGKATDDVVTRPGYKDFGPLRLNPGDYFAVAVDTDDGVLAKERFTILPDWDQDGKSDQVYGVRAPEHQKKDPNEPDSPRQEAIAKAVKRGEEPAVSTSNEEERAAAGEKQIARDAAKSAGEDVPPPPGDGTAKPTKEEKAAAKDTPEARAQKG